MCQGFARFSRRVAPLTYKSRRDLMLMVMNSFGRLKGARFWLIELVLEFPCATKGLDTQLNP